MALARLGADFDDFVRASSTDLLRLATLLTHNREDAEDLLQVAFIRTGNRWKTARNDPCAYARRVVINLSKNRWRDRSRRPETVREISDLDLSEVSGPESSVGQDAMSALIANLPLRQRKVLVLRYFADLSIAETASILGCNEGTIKSQLSRAIDTLRALMAHQTSAELKGMTKC